MHLYALGSEPHISMFTESTQDLLTGRALKLRNLKTRRKKSPNLTVMAARLATSAITNVAAQAALTQGLVSNLPYYALQVKIYLSRGVAIAMREGVR